jgi:hypothetical protein
LWAAEKLAELARPKAETGALATGTEVHAMLEDYLLKGWWPTADHPHRTKFDAVVPLLPRPKTPGMLVEHEFEFEVYPGGPIMVGGIDVALPPWKTGGDMDGTMVDLWYAGVDDHKTTSDMKYAKTPEQLAVNTQLIIYAYYLFRLPALVGWNILPDEWRPVWEGGLDRIRLRHNYIKTKNVVRRGDAAQVGVEVTWEQVAKEWAGIVADVKDMEALSDRLWDDLHAIQNEPARLDLLIQEVEGDTTAERCHMYQGCDHKGRCPEANALNALVQVETTLSNLFVNKGESNMSNEGQSQVDALAARLQERMAARTKQAPATPAASAPAPAAPAEPHPGDVGVEGYKPGQPCNGRGWYASSNGQGFIPVEQGHKCPACAHREGQPEVTPPDAPPPEVTPADLAPAPAEPTAPAEAPKAKRGRPKKTAAEAPASPATPAAVAPATTTAPAAETQPSAPASAPTERMDLAEQANPAPTPPTAIGAGGPASRIYINCRPLVGPDVASVDPLAFHKWMGLVHAEVTKQVQVPHYKLIKFGAGPGALAVVMKALLPQLPAALYVPTSHPEAQDFLDIALAREGITVIGEVR